MSAGDAGWVQAHRELLPLHIHKSSTYGSDDDRFHNFTAVSEVTALPAEYYVALRIIEKLTRAVLMIENGDACDVEEWMDCASLSLCGEALRRRAVNP